MKNQTRWLVAALAAVVLVASLTVFLSEAQSGAKRTIHVACVGDSITHPSEYPDDLGMMLGANYTVGNFGVGGTTISLQFRKPYLNQTAFQEAKTFAPDIVVIMLGTNDAYLSPQQRSNFTNDYKLLINSFQELLTKPKIFLVTPPPVFNNTSRLDATILADNVTPLVKQTANDLRLPLIDVYTPLVNYSEGFPDGIHPNSQGSEILATQIFNAINQA